MRRYLVVANETLGGSQLVDELSERAERDDIAFDVMVPATRPHEHLWWTEGTAGLHAHRRLNHIMRRLEAAHVDATGSVIDDFNPVDATKTALHAGSYDGIIVATPPAGISGPLHLDLPHRLARRTRLPVTPIVAERDHEHATA